MDHHHHLILLISLIFSLFLTIASAALAYFKLYRRYRIPLCANCRDNSDDLELGLAEARVADGPEIESDKEPKPNELIIRQFKWAEVEAGTNSFSCETIIGQGGFSTVYLAQISGQINAAVKLHRSSERLHRVFRQELDVLLRLRHPNIVRLVGYCDNQEEGALVFEYLPNGSLHDSLHGVSVAGVLTWARRISIAYQIAGAIEYLHDGGDLPIIHGDIKAANVLLDGDLGAKLIDFGSARLGFSAAIGAGAVILGSPGYVDPHYLRSGLASKKSDVYSYGVLLLELVTGLEAFMADREQRLTTAVAPLLAGDLPVVGDLVDRRLCGDYKADEAAAVLAVAASCVGENPSRRPAMGEVMRVIGEKAGASIMAVGLRSDGKRNLL